MKMSKVYFLVTMNIMSSVMMMMTESQMFMWILMEISNIMFMMMFIIMQNKNINSAALLMMIQFFSSTMILMSIIEKSDEFMSMGILMKLGMFPAHNWMPLVIYSSQWYLNMFVMTIPKIPPFLIMETLSSQSILLISASITPIIMLMKLIYNSNLKTLMAFSSILHSSWMILAQIISFKYWVLYMTLYSINTFMVCNMLNMNMFLETTSTKLMNMYMMLMLFSLMGMPPITMFLGKLYISSSVNYMILITLTSLMMSSSMSIVYYSRVFLQTMFMYKKTNKLSPLTKKKMTKIYLTMFMSLLMLII